MADTKVSALTAATTIGDTDSLYLVQGGVSKRVTPAVLRSYLTGEAILTPPVDGDFSWVNQGSATVTTGTTGIYLACPDDGSSSQFRGRFTAIPGATWTAIARLECLRFSKTYNGFGIAVRNSSSGKMLMVDVVTTDPGNDDYIQILDMSNPQTVVNTYLQDRIRVVPLWWKIQVDATNRIYSMSVDGLNWMQLLSHANTTYFTADQVGFLGSAVNMTNPTFGTNVGVSVMLTSWSLTTP